MLKLKKTLNRLLPFITAGAMLTGITVYAYGGYEPPYYGDPEETSETTPYRPPVTYPPHVTEEITSDTEETDDTTTSETEPPVSDTDETTTPPTSEESTTEPPPPPAQLELNFYENYTLQTGQGVQLVATLTNAEGYPAVTFSSSDTNVVRVDNSGYIIAIGPGFATVTAVSGDLSASAVIGVTDPPQVPEYLVVEQDSFTLKISATAQINAKLFPEEAAEGYVISYTSEDPSVASVDENGLVTALKEGQTRIAVQGAELPAEYVDITVSADVEYSHAKLSGYLYGANGKPVPGTHLVIDQLSAVTDTNGYFVFEQAEVRDMTIRVDGSDAACQLTLTEDTVIYLLFDEKKLTRLESYEALAGRLAISKVTFVTPTIVLTAGEEYELAYQYEPKDATVTGISYESSNAIVAPVGQIDGVITAKSPGETKIKLILNDGQATAECTVTVNPKESSVFSPLIIIVEGLVFLTAAGVVFFTYRNYRKKRIRTLDEESSDDDIHDIEE